MRSQAQLTIIDRADLLFTGEETQALFRHIFALELTPAQLAEYRARTQGWITALQLVRQQLVRELAQQETATGTNVGDAPDLTEVLRQSERDIFDYFAEEVFARRTGTESRSCSCAWPLLERLDLESWPPAPSRPRTVKRSSPALVRRNVFLTPGHRRAGPKSTGLHPLFCSFLHAPCAAEGGRARVAGERTAHRRGAAGKWVIGRTGACEHLLAAEAFEQAAECPWPERGQGLGGGGRSRRRRSRLPQRCRPSRSMRIPGPGCIGPRSRACAAITKQPNPCSAALPRFCTLRATAAGEAEAVHSLASTGPAARRLRGGLWNYLDQAVTLSGEALSGAHEMRQHARPVPGCAGPLDRGRTRISRGAASRRKNSATSITPA